MRKLLITSLLLLTFLFPLPLNAALDPVVNAKLSVVKLYTPEGGQCSAFAVDPLTYITAAHCVIGEDEVYRIVTLYHKGTLAQAEVYAVDPEHDLAAVKTNLMLAAGIKIGSQPKEEDSIAALGFPMDSPIVIAYYGDADGDYSGLFVRSPRFYVRVKLIGGMSGGPMVDMKGRVVSINQMSNGIISAGATFAHLKGFWEKISKL